MGADHVVRLILGFLYILACAIPAGAGEPADSIPGRADAPPTGAATDTPPEAQAPAAGAEAPQNELDALLAEIAGKQQAGELAEAAALYRRAVALARRTGSDRLGAIEKEAEALTQRVALERRASDVRAMLGREPDNVSAREGLVRLYVIELDDPAKAADVLEGVQDEDLKKYVPAAARPLEDAPELACLELGEWYRGLAETAPDHARPAMLRRAGAYLQRFLACHQAADLKQARGKLALDKVTRTMADLGVAAVAPGTARAGVAAEPSEQGLPWKHVLAFGTERSYLLAEGQPSMHEPFCARTVELWLRPSGADGTIYEEGAKPNGQALAVKDGRFRYVVREQGRPTAVEAPVPEAGRWCHVAAQFDHGRLSLCVDGEVRDVQTGGPAQVARHGEGGVLGACEKGDPISGNPDTAGFAGRVAVFRVASVARYSTAFRPDPLLKPDAATIYYLSASALPEGPVAADGVKDQVPILAETVWKPEGTVAVVAPEADGRLADVLARRAPLPGAAPAAGQIILPGKPVDLMALVDPAQDTVLGAWHLRGDTLATAEAREGGGMAKVHFPVRLLGSYRVSLCYASPRNLGVVLPVGETGVLLNLGGGDGTKCGMAMIDGQFFNKNETFVKGAIEPGREHTVDVEVRLEGDRANVTVTLDGTPLTSWSGRQSALALNPPWRMARMDCLGCGGQADEAIVLKNLRLDMLSGEARLLRPMGTTVVAKVSDAVKPPTGSAPAKPAPGPGTSLPGGPLRSQLLEAALAAEGALSNALVKQFRDYTAARLREQVGAKRLPEPFWTWLLGHAVLRDAVLLGLCPESKPERRALDRLAELHEAYPIDVDMCPHLAMAFAVAYGTAGERPIRERRLGFVADRDIPSMTESFHNYVKHAGAMAVSLTETPWPLLLFVADNDLPLQERAWVRAHYGGKTNVSIKHVYYDLEYDFDKRRGKARIGERPHTMANLLEFGGVCADRAYFSSRVAKTLGIPALYDVGAGTRGGHAWLAYVGPYRQTMDLVFSGRFDHDRYYSGTVYHPGRGEVVLDRDVQLLVAALTHSYRGYLEALAACRIYAMVPADRRGTMTGLLEAAVKRNPFCAMPWIVVSADVADGRVPRALGEQMYQTMLQQFGDYPDLTLRVLEKIFEPRIAEAAEAEPKGVTKNLDILGKAFDLYAKAERPDLAVKLRRLQGKYLEAAGRREDALKLYVTASERYLAKHYGFIELFDEACRLMSASGRGDTMLRYMARVAASVPAFRTQQAREFHEVNPSYKYVVEAYAEALRAAGRTAEAEEQLKQLRSKENKKA